MVGLTRLMSTIYPGFVFRVFHLLLGRLPSKADEFYLPKAKATGLKAPDIRLSPVVCLQKQSLPRVGPYIRLVCQEAICCACHMEHFMEVQELIFADHPGMTDHLRSYIVIPLIKKPGLDREMLKNYRPVSNLFFQSY